MCGICGIYHFNKDNVINVNILGKMCDIMEHRGPDDYGYVVFNSGLKKSFSFKNIVPGHKNLQDIKPNAGLGHRRLSIIDLTSSGHQPMANEDGTVWVVHNGELYNYIELRVELEALGHRFMSHSDTEVIIHGYEEWGEGCLSKFNGMFAFAVWDMNKSRLFAARDRLGVKPFYYYRDDKRFIFASEIKAIISDPSVERRPCYAAMYEYLRYMYTIRDHTFFEGIKKLMPGHYLSIENGKVTVQKYWDLKYGYDEVKDEKYYTDKLYELLSDSIRLRLRSDVPFGSHLSGGLDTSCIVGLMHSISSNKLITFSGRYAEGGCYDEHKYIDIISQRFKNEHYEAVPTAGDYRSYVDKLAWLMDEPSAGSGILGQYCVCRLSAQHVKVILGGQGADELFAGYYRYLPAYLKEMMSAKMNAGECFNMLKNGIKHISNLGASAAVQKISRRKGIIDIVSPDFSDLPGNRLTDSAYTYGAGNNSLDSMQYWDIKYFLPALLHVEDRTSMSVSIESRVPFLDYRIVEFSATIPFHLRMKGLVLKYIQRQMAGRFLPGQIVNRSDKGVFSPPIAVWYKNALKEETTALFFSDKFRERGIFDIPGIKSRLNKFYSGEIDYSEQMWMIINIELWHRNFIDKRDL